MTKKPTMDDVPFFDLAIKAKYNEEKTINQEKISNFARIHGPADGFKIQWQ
ncbi:MAG: hypothetical protein JRJ60_15310 [Deltaproteobacteria bacterium]|nr:hypothetical protein [Deltaproteobacteria bacterium]